jgi:cell division protein FtsA
MQKVPYFIGLDIGTANVRCVVGMLETAESENKLSIIGIGSSQNYGMRKGTVVHVEEVAQAISESITEAERLAGIRVHGATINVNGAHISSQISHGVVAISSPTKEISEDDRARVEDAATIINLPANREIIQVFAKNYCIDGQDNIKDPVGMQGVRLEVDTLVLTAGIPLLRMLDSALEKAQVNVHHHTVAGLAASEAVLLRKQKESGTAVIDIGAGTTNIAIIEEGEVEHVAVIPIGGQNITNDLAIGLKTDLDIAESVKRTHATLDFSTKPAELVSVEYENKRHSFSEKTIRLVVEARLEELFEQVDREFKKVGKSRKLPGGVVLVGATAHTPGLAEYARERLQLPARIGKIHGIGGLIDTINSSEYATAVGLMMLDMILSGQQMGSGILAGNDKVNTGLFKNFKKIMNKLS